MSVDSHSTSDHDSEYDRNFTQFEIHWVNTHEYTDSSHDPHDHADHFDHPHAAYTYGSERVSHHQYGPQQWRKDDDTEDSKRDDSKHQEECSLDLIIFT